MTRVVMGGKQFDARTAAMLVEVERITGLQLQYAQGSYNGNAVFVSGGTHAGGGAVDVRTVPLRNRAEKLRVVKALRQVGFAAWLRPYAPRVWGEHIHAIAIGCPDLSSAAASQVKAYRADRDGLAGNRPDPQASLGVKPTTWEAYLESKKPKRGRATITAVRGAWSRREPCLTARGVRHRKVGEKFRYAGVRTVDGDVWLRTLAGNWIRSSKTSRGA